MQQLKSASNLEANFVCDWEWLGFAMQNCATIVLYDR